MIRREQMNREIKARREYAKKYSFMSKPEINQFYNQDYLNAKIEELAPEGSSESERLVCGFIKIQLTGKTVTTDNVGESYFVSKAMFEALNVCRCGRKKAGTHLTKCMQKCVIKYSSLEQEALREADQATTDNMPHIPRTSNALPGFYHSPYSHLEKSTNYVSPKTHLKHKITDSIYNSIIIGWRADEVPSYVAMNYNIP